MQTSQVMNPVNALSSPAPAAKQPDANSSSAPFGQVLSREVANRHEASEAPARSDAGNTNAAKNSSTSDNKQAPEAKSADAGSAKDDTASTSDATPAGVTLPEEMLALVANLTQMTNPLAQKGETKATNVKDASTPTDPALVTAAGTTDASTIAALASTQVTDTTQALTPKGKPLSEKQDTKLSALTDKTATTRSRPETNGAQRADLPAAASAAAPDIAAKDKDPSRGTALAASVPDFANEMKESVATSANGMQQIQSAALHAAQPALAHAVEQLSPRVGTPAWDQALGQKVVWMVAGEQQSASLTLNPPDLGPLQVVLNVSNSHASATFTAAQPEVRQALEAALPKLRDMLGEAGIQLGQATVNSGSPNQHNAPDQHNAHPTHRIEQADTRNDAPIRVTRIQPANSGLGLVDTFV
ncbi:flagellar hook-length control protein FliK [Noviherbaspirillum sp.]|uniref:flagellar hook-length control protein FliK n=1 Tax=Noviherbaspirillum sp. TaxID=1926288 RepID=UPI002B495809|nr:flagellar hook-length control protein FliK [Noviherbaspirillum sp.]HJV79604.1 flagellar hook-length control protein FliK [Noviherbaspirillum sp.]